MRVEDLPAHLKAHWLTIRAKLDAREYEPSPVKRVRIPKADGGERELGIPMVRAYCASFKGCWELGEGIESQMAGIRIYDLLL
jgi:hypothetical protein